MQENIIMTQLIRMKEAGLRMEEIHDSLKAAIMDLSDSCDRLNLAWESIANRAFMVAIRSDYMEMMCLLTYVWEAAQDIKFANRCYQIAEQGVSEEVSVL